MAGRFGWRPADGAVAGFVIGAVIVVLLFGGDSGGSRSSSSAGRSGTTSTSLTTVVEATTTTVGAGVGRVPGSTTSTASTAADVGAGPTTSTAAPGPVGDGSEIDRFVARLRVAAEPPRVGYDRDLFNHWTSGSNGCSTREQVLINESRSPAQVGSQGCTVLSGDWLSIYDGYSTTDPGELDIDHVVALGEAWDSGAAGWDAGRREAFANDLAEPGALIAVTASTNRSKSDRDPASWQPPNSGAWCQFATDWVNVKVKWDLVADSAEVDALRNVMRAGCEGGRPKGSTR